MKEGVAMIKNYLKWYILLIFTIFSMIVIPFSFSKYTTTLSKALTLNIESVNISYFKEYNGSNDFLGFDKTNITSFERNTTLTKEEVLEKENVQLISSEENDEYKSSKEIYGWVEDNHFYWWSEAKTVYFHPKTLGAFRLMYNLKTVDLTGTNTSKVENFANWFANDQSLATINGKINTSGLKYQLGSNVSFYRMFYNCFQLQNIDLSEFDTKNATNMNSMFSGCKNLKELDLSNFNTSNVTRMDNMFSGCNNLKELDLSNFDTSKVTNMAAMFSYCKNLKELDLSNFDTSNVTNMNGMFQMDHTVANYNDLIVLGNKFNTSKVTSMDNMFYGIKNLKVIYVNNDFIINENTSTTNMFFKNDSIIGGYGTEYKTIFDKNHIDGEYAKISKENQSGYFTYYESIDDIKFNITYDLNGGRSNNPNVYYYGSSSFTLNIPIKEEYFFTGWTGSNGNIVEKNVIIEEGDRGNKHYVANYTEGKGNELSIPGPCTFNGSGANITGENCKVIWDDGTTIDYTNGKYIDTGIYLFSEENKNKDFEISFTIDSVNNYTNQATIINSMYETSPWPGFVFRINTANNAFELRGGYNGNKSWYPVYTSKYIVLKRENNKLYYSVDGGDLIETVDYSNYSENFDIPVTIGASLTSTGTPQRYFNGTLSNISIKLGE